MVKVGSNKVKRIFKDDKLVSNISIGSNVILSSKESPLLTDNVPYTDIVVQQISGGLYIIDKNLISINDKITDLTAKCKYLTKGANFLLSRLTSSSSLFYRFGFRFRDSLNNIVASFLVYGERDGGYIRREIAGSSFDVPLNSYPSEIEVGFSRLSNGRIRMEYRFKDGIGYQTSSGYTYLMSDNITNGIIKGELFNFYGLDIVSNGVTAYGGFRQIEQYEV